MGQLSRAVRSSHSDVSRGSKKKTRVVPHCPSGTYVGAQASPYSILQLPVGNVPSLHGPNIRQQRVVWPVKPSRPVPRSVPQHDTPDTTQHCGSAAHTPRCTRLPFICDSVSSATRTRSWFLTLAAQLGRTLRQQPKHTGCTWSGHRLEPTAKARVPRAHGSHTVLGVLHRKHTVHSSEHSGASPGR